MKLIRIALALSVVAAVALCLMSSDARSQDKDKKKIFGKLVELKDTSITVSVRKDPKDKDSAENKIYKINDKTEVVKVKDKDTKPEKAALTDLKKGETTVALTLAEGSEDTVATIAILPPKKKN